MTRWGLVRKPLGDRGGQNSKSRIQALGVLGF